MNKDAPGRISATSPEVERLDEPDPWSGAASRRPWLGIGLLAGSVISTLAVLVFFGAWFADDRIEDRASASGHEVEGDWWEDGLIAVCPIH